ncbi:transglycosylase domain-containing protein [Candidatus Gracilibacteria bacterium]|nr:transglycosylase domain-containing protein [Candidatus Gracilibacteria bacterium]
MAFQKRRVQKNTRRPLKKRAYKKTALGKNSKKGGKKSFFGKFFLYFLLGFFVFGCLGLFILYQKIIAPLPSISELESLEIAEASVIYDRDGNELYKVFEENRTYRNYEDINKNIINALVAGEDQRYWENPGVDFIGLVRAGIYGIIGKNEGFGGTSTLTQQLIRNTIIENRSSNETIFDKLERKIKEIYLAFKLTNGVPKEKIIELYLNKIAFGSNAYGIEQAAKTFFGKSAKDVGILEASMLASLPKGPSYYSPYSHANRLIGYPYVYTGEEENSISLVSPQSVEKNSSHISKLKDYISGFKVERFSDSKALICGLNKEMMKANISIDKDGCSVIDYSEFLTLLNSIKIINDDVTIEYQTGRKDFILGRMLEDEYIDFDGYREAVLAGIGFDFVSYSEDIKYPHFVFYVREFLEEKYGRELLERGGLKIYTSIDPVLQDKAEELVEKHAANNETRFAAQNAALISLDNETGEILAMVGGRDYFDEENKGNVNIVTSNLQPGSTFKPFVYSMAIDKEIIGTKTPIYDVKMSFPGGYTPNNFDGKFMGKMDVSKALNYSRNIPAVKMFYLAGGESEIIKWMVNLGVESMGTFKDEYFETYGKEYSYGASMSLGTALMTPLELAEAYSVYANMGYKKNLVPVIKILDSKGLVIEEFEKESNLGEKTIDPSTAFITNHILSDTSSRPEYWNQYLSLRGRKAAAKTGTSTKQYTRGGQKIIYPRNLWTVGYTPQVTTVVWAGNNDGTETNFSGNGLEGAGPIWKDYMEFYHSDEGVLEWKRPTGVKEVNISKISGKLAPEGLGSNFITSALFQNAPREYDNSLQPIRVDLLCNGAIDEFTPISAIGNVSLLSLHSLKPENPRWELPVQEWLSKGEYDAFLPKTKNLVSNINENTCERTHLAGSIEVGSTIKNGDTLVNGSNYIEIGYRSDQPIVKLDVFLGEEKIKQIDLASENNGFYTGDINIPKGTLGEKTLVLRAIDDEYYSQGISYNINVVKRDSEPPIITLSNPIDNSISLYKGDFFNLRGTVSDRGGIRSTNIYIDDLPFKIGLQGREFTQEIGSSELLVGKHMIRIESIDMDFNVGQSEVLLEVLERGSTTIPPKIPETIPEFLGN